MLIWSMLKKSPVKSVHVNLKSDHIRRGVASGYQWRRGIGVSLLHNFLQQILNSSSA